MNQMKTVLALVLVMVLALSLCACGGQQGETTTAATEGTTLGIQAPTETTAPVSDGRVTYTVTVTDEAGKPIVGAALQICKDTCLPGMTNEQGVAQFTVLEDDYKVAFMVVPAGYTADAEEFYFEDGTYEMTIVLKAVS